MRSYVMITGGAGYVGYRLAKLYLARTNRSVLLWGRGADPEAFAQRCERFLRHFPGQEDRIAFARGDLTDEAPFASVDPHQIDTILHPAADTHFGIERAKAAAVNVAGTTKVMDFAARCPRLERVSLVSTVYSAGMRQGVITEAAHPDAEAGFANHYEWSKFEAERVVQERFGDLPWNIIRIATFIADDLDGAVYQYNWAHKVMRLMYAGLLPIYPGDRGLPVFFVTGDFVIDAIFQLMGKAPLRSIHQVCYPRAQSTTVGHWLETAHREFLRDDDFRGRRIAMPIFTELKAFRTLARSITTFSQDVGLQATVKLVDPIAPQMFAPKDFRNDALCEVIGPQTPPDIDGLLARTCAYLVRTGWGTKQIDPGRADLVWDV